MATYFTEVDVKTDKPIEEVVEATKRVLKRVGGGINTSGNTVTVMNGANGVSMAFVADFLTRVEIEKNKDGKYTISAITTKKPNAVFWLSLVLGFCILISWVLNIMYLVADPTPQYQMALDQVQNELDK